LVTAYPDRGSSHRHLRAGTASQLFSCAVALQ
jgi:hypothetical protein